MSLARPCTCDRYQPGKPFLEGRDFVTPDDVRIAALPTLRHRIALAPELEIEGYQPDDIVNNILKSVNAPRQ